MKQRFCLPPESQLPKELHWIVRLQWRKYENTGSHLPHSPPPNNKYTKPIHINKDICKHSRINIIAKAIKWFTNTWRPTQDRLIFLSRCRFTSLNINIILMRIKIRFSKEWSTALSDGATVSERPSANSTLSSFIRQQRNHDHDFVLAKIWDWEPYPVMTQLILCHHPSSRGHSQG